MNAASWRELLPHLRTTFRSEFIFPHKKVTQWFPGHMNRGLKQMESKLKSVDLVLEVHDARIPISGRNPRLSKSFLVAKPHILVLNKADLIPAELQPVIRSELMKQQQITNVIFTNSKQETCPGLKAIVKQAISAIESSERFNRADVKRYNLMVIGVPNAGKSSLINAMRSTHMRKRKALQVGPIAGLTKAVHQEIRICNNPDMFLLDTPGIMNPNITNLETGMRLAVCSSFKDHLVGEEFVADYLLYWLNKNEEFDYVSVLGLDAPTDSINEVLIQISMQKNLRHRVRHFDGSHKVMPDFKQCAQTFINHFRQLDFGRIVIDKDLLNQGQF